MPSNDYSPGRGLTEQELKVSSFWVKNHLFLRRLGFGSLIGLNTLLWIFVIWGLLDAYVISYPRESRIIPYISQNELLAASLESTAPQPIQSSNALNFTTTEGRKDFLTQLTNPNPQWWAEFDYSFNLGELSTPKRKGYLLPNSQRYLSELGFTSSSTGIGAEVNLENIRWHRVIPTDVENNYQQFQERRLQLQTSDVVYKNEVLVGDKNIGQSTFTLSNDSAYGYWDVELTVVLLRAGTAVAVNKLHVQDLKPGEHRPVSINWGESITGVSETEISPSVNILDPKAYLPSDRF